MATANSTTTTTTGNDAAYVSGNQLADALMFVTSAMRLIEQKGGEAFDGEVFCILDKAKEEIIAAQDFLESMDPIESPIDCDVAEMLCRIGKPH